DRTVTGVQTCALPISEKTSQLGQSQRSAANSRGPNFSFRGLLSNAPCAAGNLPSGRFAGAWRKARWRIGIAPGSHSSLAQRGARSEERRVGKGWGGRG